MEIIKTENKVVQNNVEKEIYAFLVSKNPAFYKNKNEKDMLLELANIKAMTSYIPKDILNLMCNVAIERFCKDKAKDNKLVFNLDYIEQQYGICEFMYRNGFKTIKEINDNFIQNVNEVEI